MMGGSSQYKGFSKDEMKELLIDIPEEKERQEQIKQRNLGQEEIEQIKVGRTNELSSMMCLESLEQIKYRDRVNMQREILANIKAKKELAQNVVATGDFETASRIQLNQIKDYQGNPTQTSLQKSKKYLEKVKKQGNLDADDLGKAFNFHKVLKDSLET